MAPPGQAINFGFRVDASCTPAFCFRIDSPDRLIRISIWDDVIHDPYSAASGRTQQENVLRSRPFCLVTVGQNCSDLVLHPRCMPQVVTLNIRNVWQMLTATITAPMC